MSTLLFAQPPGVPSVLAAVAQSASLPGTQGPDLLRYLIACGLALLLMGGLVFGLRRVARGTMARRAAKRSLQVVDVLPLGSKQRLTVVRCYDRTFVLGVGEKEITRVAELDVPAEPIAPEEFELRTAAEADPVRADSAGFRDWLLRARPKRPAGAGAGAPGTQDAQPAAPRSRAQVTPQAPTWSPGEELFG